jgi:NADPH-dependent 2,4-dienoyl-CoA reductase/sulfur reductase-like enzyme
MEDMGLAYVDISAGIFESPGAVMDPMYYPEGWNTYTAEEVKKNVEIPVITSHSLRNPDYCEKILAEGKTDMVGMCRQLIADPYWANKARAGKKQQIRRCISCLVGCWQESLMIRRDMRCAINPAIGDERFIHLQPARKSCKVAVIGGGPAGMEAARISALRGHKATIFEKKAELGGAMLYCCTVPGKNKMRWHADWLRQQIEKLAIEVKYRTEPKVKDLKGFDVVLLAAGGRVAKPDIPGIDLSFVTTFEDVLRCKSTKCEYYPDGKAKPVECGQNVLIWGDHFGAADAAEKLGCAGKKVTIVTENSDFAEWMEPCHRDVMIKRFACGNGEGLKSKTYKNSVRIIPNSSILEIKKGGTVVIVSSTFERSEVKADTVVLARVEPNDGAYQSLLDAGLTAVRIGDSKKVRNVRGAVTDGANVALTIEEGVTLNANNELLSNLPTGTDLS